MLASKLFYLLSVVQKSLLCDRLLPFEIWYLLFSLRKARESILASLRGGV